MCAQDYQQCYMLEALSKADRIKLLDCRKCDTPLALSKAYRAKLSGYGKRDRMKLSCN